MTIASMAMSAEMLTAPMVKEDAKANIFILGAGPAGLLAAWACERLGREFVIIERTIRELPRPLRGAIYCHDPCDLPVEALEAGDVRTFLFPCDLPSTQTAEMAYHEKLWGKATPYLPNSVEGLHREPSTSPAWPDAMLHWSIKPVHNLNTTLLWLTERYRPRMMQRTVLWKNVAEWLRDGDTVISTIPLNILLPTQQLPYRTIFVSNWSIPFSQHGLVGYNLDPLTAWYRMSMLFGWCSVESITDFSSATPAKKIITSPVADELEAAWPRLILVGRWGRWQRGYLSHQAYYDVLKRVAHA